VRPVILLMGVLFLTLLPRVLLSPLLLQIEQSFSLSRTQSGALFLYISIGFSVAMLGSGFVAERLHHRGTIVLSLMVVGGACVLLSLMSDIRLLRISLVIMGMGAGLYAPSGIATLTGAAQSRHWGKALALHEIGPIMGFFAAPIVAELAIRFANWRVLFALIGVCCISMALVYRRYSYGGRFPGAAPKIRHLRSIFSDRAFWVVALLFVLALGLEIGVFSMLPTFLVVQRGMTTTAANSLVAASRLTALALVFGSGFLSDRFGAKRLMVVVCTLAGLSTLIIGVAHGGVLAVAVFLQPMLVSAFFPAGLVMLSNVAAPDTRNLVISLVIPIAYLFGAGATPVGIGALSEIGMFGAGFVILGALMMMSVVFLRLLPSDHRRIHA
jgi:MFS family permease